MKKFYTLLVLFVFASFSVSAQLEGTWKMAAQAAALGVGPGQGDISWWSNSNGDLTTRACYFDDEYIFGGDGSFQNVLGDETWLEPWQGVMAETCGAPVAPHDATNSATWAYDDMAGTLTLSGTGAYLGLPKAVNGSELTNPADAPASVTYIVVFSNNGNTMTADIEIAGGGFWRFILEKEVATTVPVLAGTWQMAPEAGSFGVGPALGDVSWFANTAEDITTRACFFDDEYIFEENGTFRNELGADTWLEAWQGVMQDGCGAPVAPHDGSNAATWTYDEMAGTVTLNGVGAFLGLAKVVNGSELASPGDAPASVTYPVVFEDNNERMVIDIDFGGGIWHFELVKTMASSVVEVVENAFNVFPNPATSQIQITSDEQIEFLTVRDITGRQLIHRRNINQNEVINVSNLPKGMYIVEARFDNKLSIKKLSVH